MNARHTPSLESLLERHREGGAFPTYAELSALAAPAAPSEQAEQAEPDEAPFLKHWDSVSHDYGFGIEFSTAYRAARASWFAAAAPAAPLPDQPEQIQPQSPDRIAKYALGEWFEARTIEEMQAFYMSRLPSIRVAAKEHGYAIGLHGSTRRDFDLMAMQWRADAADKDTLAHAIAVAACGITRDGAYEWEAKPNGRFAVSFPVCWSDHGNPDFHNKLSIGHIDLSVLEHVPAEPAGQHDAKTSIFDKPKEGQEIKVRIKRGAVIGQDFRSMKWPTCLAPRGQKVDPEMVFDAVWNGRYWDCRAHGYGKHGQPDSYGNGSLFVSNADDVHIIEPSAEDQVPAGTAGCSPSEPGAAPLPELTGPSAPTDISKRLRECASAPMANQDHAKLMLTAADECERFYGGMVAWKQTAEKKDRDWNEERMARVNERCEARSVLSVDRDSALAEAVAWCDLVGKDWDKAGDYIKFHAATYLAKGIRELKSAASPASRMGGITSKESAESERGPK